MTELDGPRTSAVVRTSLSSTIEWPTLALIVAFWVTFIGVVVGARVIPTVVLLALLAVLGGFYGSLQHEVIHRHPTPSLRVNRCFVAIPLQVWLPFERYRETHLKHHDVELTNPAVDPESFYVSSQVWLTAGPLRRILFGFNRTLLGRLTVGPAMSATGFWNSERRSASADRRLALIWIRHLLGTGAVLAAVWASPLELWVFLVGFVYGGLSLTMMRSFAEHCVFYPSQRTAVVQSGRFFGLLYLNNNLHLAHHQCPATAWYRLPEAAVELHVVDETERAGAFYAGYAQIARLHGVRSFCQVTYPERTDA